MLEKIKKFFSKEIKEIGDLKNLEQLRVKYLGRKSELTQILRSLKNFSIEKRRKIGPQAQKLKKEILKVFLRRH